MKYQRIDIVMIFFPLADPENLPFVQIVFLEFGEIHEIL